VNKILGYIGAAIMVAASFNMADDSGKIIAIVGLTILTVDQLSGNKELNLILLNLSSIAGFTYALLG